MNGEGISESLSSKRLLSPDLRLSERSGQG